MTNSANEALPVDHDTAINDDDAEFGSLEPSVDRADHGASRPGDRNDDDSSEGGPVERGRHGDDTEGVDRFGADPQELQGDDPASGGS